MRFLVLGVLLVAGCSGDESTTGIDELNLNPPSNLAITRTGVTTAALSWSDNSSGEDAFVVQRHLMGGGVFLNVLFLPANVTTAVDSIGILANSTYIYRVAARRFVESSDYTNADTVSYTIPYP